MSSKILEGSIGKLYINGEEILLENVEITVLNKDTKELLFNGTTAKEGTVSCQLHTLNINKIEVPEYDNLDIYLQKDDEIIGLHAIGDNNSSWTRIELDGTQTECNGFRSVEQWGNYYNDKFEMMGGSFRVFEDLEEVAKSFEEDGYIRIERKDLIKPKTEG